MRRRISAFFHGQRLINPLRLLSPKRLDIAAKTIFARAYMERNASKWPEKVYREHIRSINNFYEKEPRKNSYEDFRTAFIRVIEGIKTSDGWKHKEPAQIDDTFLTNGAHRVAASIVLKDHVNVIASCTPYRANWGFEYFRSPRNINWGGEKAVLDEDILDAMTIEYVSLKRKDIFVAIIFPAAKGRRDEAFKHLSNLGEIVNMKSFKHDEFNGVEVIKQLYCDKTNDDWNTGIQFHSTENKAKPCFSGEGDLQVYVIESNIDETTRIKEKQFLRALWNVDKHSIHITDTIEEANRVVRMFFNENSRRFLKIRRSQEFNSQKMYELFQAYTSLAPKDILTREKVAIEGSAVLDLLNIRDGRDIDYVSRSDRLRFETPNIERHEDDDAIFHSASIDDILTNPKYHFYYKGYKFVDIVELKKYKERRYVDGKYNQDIKDIKDIKDINAFLQKNPQYGFANREKRPEDPLVSVIIPAYNVEKFIIQCIESVVYQDYQNLEIIVIIDGSPDRSLEMVTRYAELDPRIRVVNLEKNRGLFGARMAGLNVMKGDFFITVDSDDMIDACVISTLVSEAKKSEVDIVMLDGYTRLYENSDTEILRVGDVYEKTNQTFLSKAAAGGWGWEVWGKLYRKEVFTKAQKNLQNIQQRVNLGEDVLFAVAFTNIAKSIHRITGEYGYFYRYNNTSITGSMSPESVRDKIVTIGKVVDFISQFLIKNDEKDILAKFRERQIEWIIREYGKAKQLAASNVPGDSENQQLGIKQAARKLAGAVRRRGQREVNRLIK